MWEGENDSEEIDFDYLIHLIDQTETDMAFAEDYEDYHDARRAHEEFYLEAESWYGWL